jgi:micrococcal nuclease
MSKLLSFKEESSEPETLPVRWEIGIDKRHAILYVAIALIMGFTLGFAYARFTQKEEAIAIAEPIDALPIVTAADKPDISFHKVVSILRGDTIEVEDVGTVRLIGVDTPDDNPQYSEQGKEVRQMVEQSLAGQRVRLEYDTAFTPSNNKDTSGKTLAYVYLEDGTLFNEELLKRGYAFLREKEPFGKMDDFRASEGEAIHAMRGLWGPADGSLRTALSKPTDTQEVQGDKPKRSSALPPSEIGPNLPATTTASPSEPIVFVSGEKIYHKGSCDLLGKKRTAMPVSQARSSGHVPCGQCYASTVLKAR